MEISDFGSDGLPNKICCDVIKQKGMQGCGIENIVLPTTVAMDRSFIMVTRHEAQLRKRKSHSHQLSIQSRVMDTLR